MTTKEEIALWLVLFAVFCILLAFIWPRRKRPTQYVYSAYWMDHTDGQEPGFYYVILDWKQKPVSGDGPFNTIDAASLVAKLDCDLWNQHGRGLKDG